MRKLLLALVFLAIAAPVAQADTINYQHAKAMMRVAARTKCQSYVNSHVHCAGWLIYSCFRWTRSASCNAETIVMDDNKPNYYYHCQATEYVQRYKGRERLLHVWWGCDWQKIH